MPEAVEFASLAFWWGGRRRVRCGRRASAGGYPIHEHIARLLDGEIIWAPAIDGAFLLSTRGGDFELRLGQDVSIGYLSHDATSVELYFQESLTFLAYTSEAVVPLRSD